jgi:hypothetical protein
MISNRNCGAAAFAALCLASAPAAGQQSTGAPPVADRSTDAVAKLPSAVATAGDAIGRQIASPDQDLRTGFAASGIVLTSDLGKTDASIAISRSTSRLDAAGRHLVFNAFTGKVSAPVNKDTGEASFLTDAGLPGAISLELGFASTRASYFSYSARGVTADQIADALDAAAARCESAKKTSGSSYDCTPNDVAMRKWLTPEERQLIAAPIADQVITTWALSGGIGSASYDWRDALTLKPASAHRTVYHITAELGGTLVSRNSLAGGWHLGIGGEYRHDYSEAKKQILCSPPPATGPQECFQSPFAAPGHDNKAMAFVIARRRFYIADLDLPLGVQIKGTRDFLHHQWGGEVALYGFADAKGKLQGGIKAKFQSHDDDPSTKEKTAAVAIFVGTAY